LSPIAAGHDRDTWPSPGVAVKLAGGARLTRRVVAAARLIVPLVPVTVREMAKGLALDPVLKVSVEVPEPLIEAGLKPPLVTPAGKPFSVAAVRVTGSVKPLMAVTVTVNVVDWLGLTIFAGGLTVSAKSGVGGVTVIVRVGGLGSEFPSALMTFREVV
jgi:hypothetical protein